LSNYIKYTCALTCTLLLSAACQTPSSDTSYMNVMSFNIRYNNPDDGENAWPYRKKMVADIFRNHAADLVGIQEALASQVDTLAQYLPEFAWFGVGRDDGKKAGEFMAVFYRKSRFKQLDGSTFWLAETPKVPTMGWDAVCYRTVAWGKFEDLHTGTTFYLFNTHFDHKGKTARRESAKLLLTSIQRIAGENPVIVTGDFNATPKSEPIQVLVSGIENEAATALHNAKSQSRGPHIGPAGTFTGFTSATLHEEPIDYIFTKNRIEVLQHSTISESFDGRFPSDHMPVLAKLTIQ